MSEYKVNIHPSIHHQTFQDEKVSDRSHSIQSLSISKNVPHLIKGEEILNVLKIGFFLLIGISFALSIFSWYTWKHTDSKNMLTVLSACLIAIIGSILGLIASFKTIQEHHQLIQNKREYGADIMMISFYFLIIDFILYSVFGTAALIYTDSSIKYINDLYKQDQTMWRLLYGDKTLEEVQDWVVLMIHLIGYICYIMIVLIVIISVFIFKLRKNSKEAPRVTDVKVKQEP